MVYGLARARRRGFARLFGWTLLGKQRNNVLAQFPHDLQSSGYLSIGGRS